MVNCKYIIDGKKCNRKGSSYRKIGTIEPTHCHVCETNETNMEHVSLEKKCLKCKKKDPSYGLKNTKTKLYCTECAKSRPDFSDLINIRHPKTCKCKNDPHEPNFAEKYGDNPVCCSKCKTSTMVDVCNFKCKCKKSPSFANEGEKKKLYCADCRPDPNIQKTYNPDFNRIKCVDCEEGKEVTASYSKDYISKITHCGPCRKKIDPNRKMVYRKGGICTVCKDSVSPSYAKEGERKGTHCAKCKLLGMKEVKHEKCIEEGCNSISPSYAIEGSTQGTHCKDCADYNMVNVKHPKCKCGKSPCFAEEGSRTVTCCDNCKKLGMENIYSQSCNYDKCEIWAGYGLFGKEKTKCTRHKDKNMFYLPTKTCEVSRCKDLATHGLSVISRRHCDDHSIESDIKFFVSTCVSCDLTDLVLDSNNLCESCDPKIFGKNKMRKQEEILNLLKNNNLDDFKSYDRSLESIFKEKCSLNSRPDFLYDCDHYYLVLEVDENQHVSNECDVPRMINISQTLGLPTVYIRYNPDSFTIKSGRKSTITVGSRQKQLLKIIKEYKKFEIGKLPAYCFYTQLFYNGYDDKNIKPIILSAFD